MLIRRSNLVVPITDTASVTEAWRHNADAVTLDLEDGVAASSKSAARELVRDAIQTAGRGTAEVFVRVNKAFAEADIEASVWPGLSGIVLPQVESSAEVADAAGLLDRMERRRGVEVGSLQLVLLIESARGVWDIRDILTASPRTTQAGLDESDLAASMGINVVAGYDPFVYARGRLAIESTAAGVQAIGVAHPMGALPRLLPQDELLQIATDSKNLGFKGMLCPHTSWVAPVNSAFTPTESQVDYYTQVRQVFANALAAGTAAAPFAGRMIDVPVDEWAKVVLEMAAACAARDLEKQKALARANG
jgi:citrate lyase subunit beta/citryl-CoA lyase